MVYVFRFGHIRLNGDYAPAIARTDLLSRLLSIFQTEIGDDYISARRSQSPDDCAPNASRATGDYCCFAIQIKVHWFSTLSTHR